MRERAKLFEPDIAIVLTLEIAFIFSAEKAERESTMEKKKKKKKKKKEKKKKKKKNCRNRLECPTGVIGWRQVL